MNWFLKTKSGPAPQVRLYCFPYAGAGATAFAMWGTAFPSEIAVLGVQPPGKGWRMEEPPLTDLGHLADQVAQAIREEDQGPFAFFGHSMGACLAFEVVRRLEGNGAGPTHLLVSGRQAPSVGHLQAPISHLEDRMFIEAVGTRYGGLPAEVMENPELLEAFLPSLKADFKALESFDPSGDHRVRAPITALVGASDPIVKEEHILPWADATQGSFQHRVLPGGHLYLNERPKPLQDEIVRALLPDAPTPPSHW